ncbi:MAG: hypothetical protein WCH43_02360 [Verrucomicrobiota bacterium]
MPTNKLIIFSLALNLGLAGLIAYTLLRKTEVTADQPRVSTVNQNGQPATLQPPPTDSPVALGVNQSSKSESSGNSKSLDSLQAASPVQQTGHVVQDNVQPLPNPVPVSPSVQPAEPPPFDIVAPVGKASVPIALTDLGEDLHLSGLQQAQLNTLRQKFIDAVGGTSQDAADPAYLQRWQTAQRQSDLQFWQMFGTDALFNRQMQARIHPQTSAP